MEYGEGRGVGKVLRGEGENVRVKGEGMEGGGEGGFGRARKEMGKGKTSCDGDFLGLGTGTFYIRRLVVEVVIICKRILLYCTTG